MTNQKLPDTKPMPADTNQPNNAALDTSSSQLLIHSRPVVGHSITVRTSDEAASGDPDPVQLQGIEPSKRPVLAPAKITGKPTAAAESAAPKGSPADSPSSKPSQPASNGQAFADVSPPMSSPNAPSSPATSPTANPETEPAAAPTTSDAFGPDDSDTGSKQPSTDTKKAVAAAAKATKRQQELQGYINSREFFVPITTGERRRSIKVSSILTVVIFILALVLIDLMLDSGTILLVQKIPHTHFFSMTNSTNS